MSSASLNEIRIVIDAMGGDYAPRNVIHGTLSALRETKNRFHVILVGKEKEIQQELQLVKGQNENLSIVHAEEILDMHDAPTSVLKSKRNSSISVGVVLQKEGKADAFVSAGNTGAVMSAGTLILGRIPGVSRPTIGAFFPTESGVSLLLDAGANVDSRPQHLYEFAIMGSIYANAMFGIQNPKVGLLNVGEEKTKGNEVALETHNLLSHSQLNFIGNVEGRDVLKGTADLVVCDGFVGNIILKFAESVPSFLKSKFKQYAETGTLKKLLIGSLRGTLRKVFKSLDYEEYGGVPLLGVNGVIIIGHGGSSAKAIKNMILKAEETVQKKINERITKAISEMNVETKIVPA
ncbi:MAG: phosphate acyltransferase PlsX [Ignavibacteriales bacterium]|nr:phosphate acyltransferase PlsX [Ignavibacteriales bacterium]